MHLSTQFHGEKPVHEMYAYPESWEGRDTNKHKATSAKAHGNAPVNLPRVPTNIPGKTSALAWF